MRKTWLFAFLGVCALSAFANPALADPPSGPIFQVLGNRVDHIEYPGHGQFAIADLDQDGVPDLVFGGVSANSVLFVLGKQADGDLGIKQALVTPDLSENCCGFAQVMRWHRSPGDQIVTVSPNGVARIYAGMPLSQLRQFPVASDATSAAIGDADGDGSDELLVLSESGLYAYALDDGSEEWSYFSPDCCMALAQLDDDPALEIVLAEGLVLDGATREVDWSYIDSFGGQLATGILSPGGTRQWVGSTSNQFTVFQSNPWSPVWDMAPSMGIKALATGDIDGNGIDSILYSGQFEGSIHIINPVTHQERMSIAHQRANVRAIAVADINGDGEAEVVFSSDSTAPDLPALSVASSKTGEILWSAPSTYAAYGVAAIGDVDGDGRNELVAAGGDNFSDAASVSIYDMASGRLEWTSPKAEPYVDDPFHIEVGSITLSPRVTGGGMDIILAGEEVSNGKVVVIDGVTKSPVRLIGNYLSPVLGHRTIRGVALFDFNDDGIKDLVVATQANSSEASGAKLSIISGVDDTFLWESAAMGSGLSPINGVFVMPPESPGGASEIVADLPGSLRAYNSQTQMLDWVLTASNHDAKYIDAGISGPEIMLLNSDGAVSFHDAQSRDFLRDFSLPATLTGIIALQGDVHTLLATSNQRLMFVDGSNGSVLASSQAFLGEFHSYTQPAAVTAGDYSWNIALPTRAALWRIRLDASDRIFMSDFD